MATDGQRASPGGGRGRRKATPRADEDDRRPFGDAHRQQLEINAVLRLALEEKTKRAQLEAKLEDLKAVAAAAAAETVKAIRRAEDGASEVQAAATPRAELDVRSDPRCVAIRQALASGPRTLRALERDPHCPSRRVISELLGAMRRTGLVQQTAPRGPWTLTNHGSE